ncbi:hypothetical protein GOODEAATRI_009501, partial [Goodea atripinnis]
VILRMPPSSRAVALLVITLHVSGDLSLHCIGSGCCPAFSTQRLVPPDSGISCKPNSALFLPRPGRHHTL